MQFCLQCDRATTLQFATHCTCIPGIGSHQTTVYLHFTTVFSSKQEYRAFISVDFPLIVGKSFRSLDSGILSTTLTVVHIQFQICCLYIEISVCLMSTGSLFRISSRCRHTQTVMSLECDSHLITDFVLQIINS